MVKYFCYNYYYYLLLFFFFPTFILQHLLLLFFFSFLILFLFFSHPPIFTYDSLSLQSSHTTLHTSHSFSTISNAPFFFRSFVFHQLLISSIFAHNTAHIDILSVTNVSFIIYLFIYFPLSKIFGNKLFLFYFILFSSHFQNSCNTFFPFYFILF